MIKCERVYLCAPAHAASVAVYARTSDTTRKTRGNAFVGKKRTRIYGKFEPIRPAGFRRRAFGMSVRD